MKTPLECIGEGVLLVGTLLLWSWAFTVLSNMMGG